MILPNCELSRIIPDVPEHPGICLSAVVATARNLQRAAQQAFAGADNQAHGFIYPCLTLNSGEPIGNSKVAPTLLDRHNALAKPLSRSGQGRSGAGLPPEGGVP